MNCSVCGKPLLFSRVAFKCSCGAYVHAYCLDQHILEAHRPEVEEGNVDLNSDFHPVKVAEPELEVVEESALAAGFELPDEAEAIAGAWFESGVEESKAKGEEVEAEKADAEDDLSPGELVVDQAPEEGDGASSDSED
ncbi:C1 domain-containing protein [Chloroflexota bacterium]